ncbi:Hypothetical predicted protein, partial [Mytilus galloprovincialis]
KIEIAEEDKITKLQNQIGVMNKELKDQHKRCDEKFQNQMDIMNREFKDQHKRNDKMLKTIKENMKINHENMKEITSMINTQFKHNTEQECQPAFTQL